MSFATRILPHLADADNAGHLIAKKGVAANGLTLATPVPAAVANSLYKGEITKVHAIASHPGTDPSVLAKYAKDSRVSVRHALLGNAALPYAQAVELLVWAHERGDHDVISKSLTISYGGSAHAGLAPRDVPACLGKLRATTGYPYRALAAILKEHGDAEDIWAAWNQRTHVKLRSYVLLHAYNGDLPVSYGELVAADKASKDTNTHTILWRNVLAMAKHVAHVNEAYADDLVSAAEAEPYAVAHTERLRFTTIDPAARDLLLASAVPAFVISCLAIGENSDALASSLSRAGAKLIGQLLRDTNAVGRLTVEQQQQLVAATFASANQERMQALFRQREHLPHPLSYAELEKFFDYGGMVAIGDWISGRLPNQQPQPGEILRLGRELPRYVTTFSSFKHAPMRQTHAEALEHLLWHVATLAGNRTRGCWEDEEILTVFDTCLVPRAGLGRVSTSLGSALWSLVAFDLERRIHGDRGLLDTVVGLADEWEGGFDSLVSAAGIMDGTDVSRPSGPPAGDEPLVDANGQLRLL